jgi:hypothetical protein
LVVPATGVWAVDLGVGIDRADAYAIIAAYRVW